MIQLIVFLPLAAALVAGLGNRAIGDFAAKLVTTVALFVSAALSWLVFTRLAAGGAASTAVVAEWIHSGTLRLDWAFKVDMLTGVMLVVVTSVSALVHLYSWGYMAEDPSQPRFFAYLSLFTFAMLMLVTANNLVQMFFGWEGVGLASYLLIGFWYDRPSANAAAIKAFVVNRVGDFGFTLGIFGAFLVFRTVDLDSIFAAAPALHNASFFIFGAQLNAVTTVCLLLFVGACGKSAQLGLHTWLPDAMEGPTPVSALIHAATMVTAGVFLLCRMSPLFVQSEVALHVVTYVGAATALFAATVACVQTDIKRVIAYSTCSQLGYMVFAAGVGAGGAAMFHLFTHAFFKALLFLGAGSVIHAMHHEQDMRYYGGLRRAIPLTFAAMTVGTLALTGFYFTAGYYSKDGILEAAFARGTEAAVFAFVVGAFVAFLTSFYSWRLVFLTFFGQPRWAGSAHIAHAGGTDGHEGTNDSDGHDAPAAPMQAQTPQGTGGYHPHESPWTMLVPLGLLSLGALFAGYLFHDAFIGEAARTFWRGSVIVDQPLHAGMEAAPQWVKLLPGVMMLAGLALAYRNYIVSPERPARFVATFPPLYAFLTHKWYFDELYNLIFVRPAFWFGRQFWRRGDQRTIDRFGPDGVASVVSGGGAVLQRLQTGYVYTYALVMLIGLAAAATLFMFRPA